MADIEGVTIVIGGDGVDGDGDADIDFEAAMLVVEDEDAAGAAGPVVPRTVSILLLLSVDSSDKAICFAMT